MLVSIASSAAVAAGPIANLLHTRLSIELGQVDGEMFDWWFSNVENTERYRWSHPDSHISASWDPTFYAVRPHERKPGKIAGPHHKL
jgi:hypothetical protein